jgi:hypothetical protein
VEVKGVAEHHLVAEPGDLGRREPPHRGLGGERDERRRGDRAVGGRDRPGPRVAVTRLEREREPLGSSSHPASLAGEEIPVLGPTELATFKARFDRSQDWVDIQAMIAAERLDLREVREALSALVGAGDQRFDRLEDVARRAVEEPQQGD